MKCHVTNEPASFCNVVETFQFASFKRYKYTGISRKSPCPCGSGKKYKHCCANKADENEVSP